jgi:hypothetical protein
VVLEAMPLKPQREAGEEAFRALLTALLAVGVARVTVTTNPLTKLQILRIAKEQKAKALLTFASINDATR